MLRIQDIEQARRRIEAAVLRSPCAESGVLGTLTGSTIFLKLENLQLTGSFKERGACNKLLTLGKDERARGVVTASAGNHGQAVAYHASRLGIAATVVMPEPSPLVKVQSTRSFGARVILHGTTYDDAAEQASVLCEHEGAVYVHPFDDELVIAGQGTLGLELLEQNPFLEAVVVPVGGGGLIAGIACAIKETNPRIQVYGVEPDVLPSMARAVDSGAPVTLASARTIADGIAVKRVGERPLELVKRYVDGLTSVDEEEIAAAILVLLEREKTVAEGAGAAGLAALLHQRFGLQGKRVAVVLSGGNIDVNLISRIIERGLVKTGRLVRIRVTVPDVAGALAGLTRAVAEVRANVVEIHHDRAFSHIQLGETDVELVLETRGFDHIQEVGAAIQRAGYHFVAR
jgi:threonine dehydratase